MTRTRQKHDGTPRLFQKKNGKFYVLLTPIGGGIRQWIPCGTDQTAAKARLAIEQKRHGAAQLGLLDLPSAAQGKVTIEECLELLADNYARHKRRSQRTARHHRQQVRTALGALRVNQLTTAKLTGAIDAWQAAGYAEGTINIFIAMLHRALVLAVNQDPPLIAKLPLREWHRFKLDNARQIFVEPEELAVVNAHEPYEASRDLNITAFWLGMRWGALTTLTWDGYDPRTFTIRLHPKRSKNGKPIAFPIPEGHQLREVLARRWADRRPGCALVFHHDGRPILDKERWAHAWHRAGLPMVPPRRKRSVNLVPEKIFHDLRRSGSRNLIRAGVSEQIAMLVTGHKTRQHFDRYNISTEADVANALQALAAKFAPIPHLTVVPSSARTRPALVRTPASSARASA